MNGYHGVHRQSLCSSSFEGESALLAANDLVTWIRTLFSLEFSRGR